MQIEWLSIIQGQQKVAKDAAAAVMGQLSNRKLTARDASKLRNDVDAGSLALNALLRSLRSHVIDEAFFFSAASLKDFWVDLALVVEKRQQELVARKTGKASRIH